MRIFRSGFFVVLVCAAVSALTTASCGTHAQPPSGVIGRMVTWGGLEESPTPNITIAAHKGDSRGEILGTATSDATGRFQIDLPPGNYTLVPNIPPDFAFGAVPASGAVSASATVEPGRYVHVTVGFMTLED